MRQAPFWDELVRPIRRLFRRRSESARSLKAIAALASRLEKLELLTEHPEFMSTTMPAPSLPSPAVSIVTPTWNRAGVIGAAIRSVQAQTFQDWELVVVDDGSADETEAVVASFAADRRIRYVTQEHAGQSAARNRAFQNASGALIAYLDSDNIWYPEFLAVAVAVFSARPEIDCAYGAMVREARPKAPPILHEPFDRARLLDGNFIGISTFVHRRGMIERFGGFDEQLESLEDWDLILRYTSHNPAYRLPVRAVRRRVMDENRVSEMRRHDRADALIRSKWAAR